MEMDGGLPWHFRRQALSDTPAQVCRYCRDWQVLLRMEEGWGEVENGGAEGCHPWRIKVSGGESGKR